MTDSNKELYIDSKKLHKEVKERVDKGYRNILIKAPIESGKTSFIYDHLVQDTTIRSIVMLSNRTLLKEQTKEDLKSKQIGFNTGDNKAYCYQIIGNILYGDDEKANNFRKQFKKDNDFSEEELEELYEHVKQFIEEDIKEVDYLILDEAHYFTSDSIFNKNTEKEFEYLYNECKGTKLYMTATPEAFIEAVTRYEQVNKVSEKDKLIVLNQLKQETREEKEMFYDISTEGEEDLLEHVKDHYRFNFIHESERDQFLSEQIKMSTPTNKMIYFVRDKFRGALLSREAKGMTYRDNNAKGGAFICSLYDDKYKKVINMEERERIIKKKYFESDVLVTTSVLNNGVNIHDENVKRIIIDYVDVGEAVQMMGRIRAKQRSTDNKLEVTIILPTLKHVIENKKNLAKNIATSEGIFKREQYVFQKTCIDQLLSDKWIYETPLADEEDEEERPNYPDLSVYFAHLYYLLTNHDKHFYLESIDSPFYVTPQGLEKVSEIYLAEKEKMIQEKKERAEKKERERKSREFKRLSNIQACFDEYGDRELLKNEFDVLANELNFKNKDGSISKTVKSINNHLAEYGYRIESKISREKNTRDKKIYRIVKD